MYVCFFGSASTNFVYVDMLMSVCCSLYFSAKCSRKESIESDLEYGPTGRPPWSFRRIPLGTHHWIQRHHGLMDFSSWCLWFRVRDFQIRVFFVRIGTLLPLFLHVFWLQFDFPWSLHRLIHWLIVQLIDSWIDCSIDWSVDDWLIASLDGWSHLLLVDYLQLILFLCSWFVQCLLFRTVSSCFCSIFAPDLTPNIGLFWYFFTEMFEQFRNFFTYIFFLNICIYSIPVSIKLRYVSILYFEYYHLFTLQT